MAFTGNYSDLTGKPASFPPASHKHGKADITDFPSSLPASDVKAWAKAANKPSYTWSEIGGKPSAFPPASHTHAYLPLSGGMLNGELEVKATNNNLGISIYNSETEDWLTVARSQNRDGGDKTANIMGISGWRGQGASSLYVGGILFKSSVPQLGLYHTGSVNGVAGFRMWITDNVPYIVPAGNGTHVLGDSSSKWKQIYSVSPAISTSDREVKKEISYTGSKEKEYTSTYMDDAQLISLILGLKPCVYKFKENDSNRPHHGLIAQDVEELLQKLGIKDHAAFIKSPKTRDVEVEEKYTDKDGSKKTRKRTVQEEIPGEYIYGLRYEEFISDIIRFCQILYNRNTELETALEEQKKKAESLEKRIETLENIINQRA